MKNKLKSKNLKSAVLFLVDKNIKLGAFVIFLSMLGKTLMLFNRSESLLDEILKIAINISIVLIIVLLICISYLAILNLSKLPFNEEELTKHKITTPDEYLEFINEYLRPLTNYESFILDEQRRNKIIITSYLNLYDKDTDEEKEKTLQNVFSFNKEAICDNNYDFIYDFDNEITVNNEENFDKLVNKLFNKELYDKLFVLEDQPQKENENWYEVAIILLFLLFLLYLLNHSIF
jgi:hypothetical protein